MAILVVGSVAFDSLETPSGKRERVLGGAATHFSLAASFFTQVRVVGVVGEDFTAEEERVMTDKGVDTRGLERAPGKSFHWTGSYLKDLNEADTLATDLNVFAAFEPKIPDAYKDSEYLFLANIDPVLQLRVRQAMPNVKMVAGDTMNYWMTEAHRDNLLKVLPELDVLIINDKETRILSGEANGLKAAKKVLEMG
ncbi:MAG TPA: PfkB family carbohydrate kinase, partial [Acidobacteriaceae bacterium]|nr:PfkB family carbohydrate kinase [Acidobacteriaceae bacterium]